MKIKYTKMFTLYYILYLIITKQEYKIGYYTQTKTQIRETDVFSVTFVVPPKLKPLLNIPFSIASPHLFR